MIFNESRFGSKLTDKERRLIKDNTTLADYGRLEMAFKDDPNFCVKAGTIDAVVRQQRNLNGRNFKIINNLWSIAAQNAASTKAMKEQQLKDFEAA